MLLTAEPSLQPRSNFFLDVILIFKSCEYMSVCGVFAQKCRCPQRPEEILDTLELELYVIVSFSSVGAGS